MSRSSGAVVEAGGGWRPFRVYEDISGNNPWMVQVFQVARHLRFEMTYNSKNSAALVFTPQEGKPPAAPTGQVFTPDIANFTFAPATITVAAALKQCGRRLSFRKGGHSMPTIFSVPRLFLVPKKKTDRDALRPSGGVPGSVRIMGTRKRPRRRSLVPEDGPPAAA